ncbi:OsmC family protein [Kordiimonas laminariae]|uniref:OsmC family protein n=1 Tax=Kordiimonas laminariae TaxID=2917717 RepID=UPI001FF278F8|nr:OsmC family protein [Kordiimonas laminariae]MCK0070799.1 OsmC family protein [Kordiimonas laminariae]
MTKQAKVKWAGDMTFIGESPSGHSVLMDSGSESGGLDHAIRPMEMLLLGAGGCASIDVVMILKKARQDIKDVWVELDGERAEEMPKYFTKIHMHFVVEGKNISEKHVERAIQLSMDKYCSASAQLAALANITTDFEIREVD